jgi:hypothetical protein
MRGRMFLFFRSVFHFLKYICVHSYFDIVNWGEISQKQTGNINYFVVIHCCDCLKTCITNDISIIMVKENIFLVVCSKGEIS